MVTFGRAAPTFEEKFEDFLSDFAQKKWPIAHFLPTFKNKNGHEKPSVYAGLRALGYCSLQRLLQQIFNEI